jgi:hypothetical protein
LDDKDVTLKQYKESEIKSELEKVTDLPDTATAFAEIPGQTDESSGRFEVSVVQLELFVSTVNESGKVTVILFSIPARGDEAFAQTVASMDEFAA